MKETAAAPGGFSDAEIIRLAAIVVEKEAAYRDAFDPAGANPEAEAEREAARGLILDASCDAAFALSDLPAASFIGAAAKAQAAIAAHDPATDRGDYVRRMVWSAADDLARLVEPSPAETVMIDLYGAHPALIEAVNQHGRGLDDCPHWLAYAKSRDAISSSEPRTMAGLAAKARAACAEMRNPADGTYQLHGTVAEGWAEDILLFLEEMRDGFAEAAEQAAEAVDEVPASEKAGRRKAENAVVCLREIGLAFGKALDELVDA